MPIISMADDIIFFFERVKEMHLCSLSILSIVIPLFTYGHSKKWLLVHNVRQVQRQLQQAHSIGSGKAISSHPRHNNKNNRNNNSNSSNSQRNYYSCIIIHHNKK